MLFHYSNNYGIHNLYIYVEFSLLSYNEEKSNLLLLKDSIVDIVSF